MSDADREKWNQRYAEPASIAESPSAVLAGIAPLLPTRGAALDVAGGAGRHAIWLAQRGLTVTIADISETGLKLARQRAQAAGVLLQTSCVDLESGPLPAGPWDLVLCVCYLWRPLFRAVPAVLAEQGMLVVIQPTRSNLQRHSRPPENYLLEDRELPGLASGLQLVHYEEGWSADGRHDAVLVARKAKDG